MEERTDESPNPKSTELEDGVPMERGFVVGAVVGLLILVSIPLLAKHFRDSGETESRMDSVDASVEELAPSADGESEVSQ